MLVHISRSGATHITFKHSILVFSGIFIEKTISSTNSKKNWVAGLVQTYFNKYSSTTGTKYKADKKYRYDTLTMTPNFACRAVT
jgi:hypothetical protein